MQKLSVYSYSSKETIDLAKRLAGLLKKGDLLGLFGNLGSGKTTFVKGIAKGLGLKAKINSPSFVILKIYSFKDNYSSNKYSHNKKTQLFHFDLYRLRFLKEIEDIGYDDFISTYGICVIEWADKARKLLPNNYLKIEINIKGKDKRLINLIGYGKRYDSLVEKMKLYRKEHRR